MDGEFLEKFLENLKKKSRAPTQSNRKFHIHLHYHKNYDEIQNFLAASIKLIFPISEWFFVI
jgi:cephalosporin-C deacetylase-like acetyl esterase